MAERTEPVKVSINDIKTWLSKGVTRCVDDPGYREDIGSIQEKYGLDKTEVRSLFQDERLKGLRVNKASRILIVEDIEEDTTDAVEEERGAIRETVITEESSEATEEVINNSMTATASHPLEEHLDAGPDPVGSEGSF